MIDRDGATRQRGKMIDAFLRTPLRFWFRVGVVVSVLWLVAGTLRNWSMSLSDTAHLYLLNLRRCEVDGAITSACAHHAGQQFDLNRSSAWPTAIVESILQLVFFWFVAAVVIIGMRWACRTLRPSGTGEG